MNYQNILFECLEDLRLLLDDQTFTDTFTDVDTVVEFNNGYIHVLVPDEYTKSKIEQYYLIKLNELLSTKVEQNIRFKLVLRSNVKNSIDQKSKKSEKESLHYRGEIKYNYTFENFVVGSSNNLATKLALNCAELPGTFTNPLFIFGTSGLGKTHLMHAIGNRILDKDINQNVVYLKTENFADDYYKASLGKDWLNFNEKYSDADVLLVDDIQQLPKSTKEIQSIQNAFFKLFEELYNKNKQIVITCDKKPSALKHLPERLISRFEMGQVVSIAKPDIEHCKSIIERKFSMSIKNPEIVPPESIEYIAMNFGDNVRKIEGALKRLIFFTTLFEDQEENPYSLDIVKQALKDLLANDIIETRKEGTNRALEILREVSKYFSVSIDDMLGKSRKQTIVYPRQVCMYLIKNILNLTYAKIGEIFGGKDHTTVMHSVERITQELEITDNVKRDIDKLTKVCK